MENDINREIAEGLEREGLVDLAYKSDEVVCTKGHGFRTDVPFAPIVGRQCSYMLACDGTIVPVPYDFTDPRYLFPALEAWRKQDPGTRKWRIESAETGTEVFDGLTPERKDYGPAALIGERLYMCDDGERDPIEWGAECFHAALGAAAE